MIMDPVWGYEAINVEAQQGDPSSLLNWMRNMIALRKLFGVFGRGSIEFLNPSNRKVLAYLRQYQGEQVLCVANLSRFAQPVDLDLSKLEGMVPVEMLGYVEFPAIERQPYRLTLAPYSFLWLELQRRVEPAEASVDPAVQAPLNASAGWEGIFDGVSRQRLETVYLPEYLPKQRWFAGKSRHIQSTRIVDWTALNGSYSALAFVEVQFDTGASEVYLALLAMTFGDAADELRHAAPNAIVASILSAKVSGLLHDGVFDDKTCLELLSLIENGRELSTRHGRIRGVRGKAFQNVLGSAEMPLPVRRSSAEQSNTSILFGDRFILKLFRHLEPGLNPDAEIGRYLTEKTNFDRIPPFAGSIELRPAAGAEPTILAMLQGLVANEGDGWKWTVEELDRYFETCAPLPFPERRNRRPAKSSGPFRATRLSSGARPSRHLSGCCQYPRTSNRRDASGAGFADGRSGFRPRTAHRRRLPKCACGPSPARLPCLGPAERARGVPARRSCRSCGHRTQPAPPYSGSFWGAQIEWISDTTNSNSR